MSEPAPPPQLPPQQQQQQQQQPPAKRRRQTAAGRNIMTGNAESTDKAFRSAINAHDKVVKALNEGSEGDLAWPTFESICDQDVEGDNLVTHLCEVANGLANEEFVKINGLELVAQTRQKYFLAMANELRKRFPNNAAFQDETLVSRLKGNIGNFVARRLQNGSNEDAFGTSCIPFYDIAETSNATYLPGKDKPEPMESDLFTIHSELMASGKRGAHETILQNLMTYHAIGRGGEVKFVTYDKMYWDNFFMAVVSKWFQMKQLTSKLTSFGPHFSTPELCIWFAFGCFFCAENGLARENHGYDPESPEGRAAVRKQNYVFQHLHAKQDSSVAAGLTKALKDLLPASLKTLISIKSLRVSSTTQLGADPKVTVDEGNARGGWATGSNRDFYNYPLVVSIIPPMLSLNRFPNPRVMKVKPPNLHVLRTKLAFEQKDPTIVETYMDSLYEINVRHFKGGEEPGKLRRFLEGVTASLIMHFRHVLEKYTGRHPVVRKMQVQATKVFNVGADAATKMLLEWSDVVKKEFQQSRGEAEESGHEINDKLSRIEAAHASDRHAHREEVNSLNLKINHLSNLVIAQNQQFDSLQQTIAALQQTIASTLNQPSRGARRISSSPGGAGQTVEVSTAPSPPDTAPATSPAVASLLDAAPAPSPAVAALPSDALQEAAAAAATTLAATFSLPSQPNEARNATNQLLRQAPPTNAAKESVSDVLCQLYSRPEKVMKNLERLPLNQMRHRTIDTKCDRTYQRAMELVDALMTDEQRRMAIDGTADMATVRSTFLELNDWTVRAQLAMKSQANGKERRTKCFWLGVGNKLAKKENGFARKVVALHSPRERDGKLKHLAENQTLRHWIVKMEERIKRGEKALERVQE